MKLLKETCVLVKADVLGETSESGLVLSGDERGKKQEKGKVVATGDDVDKVSLGDNVMFKMYHTHTIEVDGQEFELIEEEDLIATYED